MPRNAEARIQASVVAYVRQVAPQVLCFAVPNGGLRTKAEASLMRWTGVVAGIPDLVLVGPRAVRNWNLSAEPLVAFWEVKTPAGRLSPPQAEMLARLDDMGVPNAIIRSIDDARRELAALGIPTRERQAA